MVTKQSANHIGPHVLLTQEIPMEADHRGLVKFSSESDTGYSIVCNRLQIFIQSAPTVIQRRFNEGE